MLLIDYLTKIMLLFTKINHNEKMFVIIKKLIIIEKICNDNDNDNENDNLSSISIEVNRTVFVLYFFYEKILSI